MKQLFSTALDLADVRPVQFGPVGEHVFRPSVFLPQRPNVGPDGPDFSLDDLYQEQFEATGDCPTGSVSTDANKEPTPAIFAPLGKPLVGADLPCANIRTPAPDNPDHPDIPTVYYHQPSDRGPRHARFPEINVSATGRLHGISTAQLSRLLNGENSPSLKSLFLLSAILKLPVEEVAEMYKTRSGKPVRGKVKAK
jgi:hypothetical protein